MFLLSVVSYFESYVCLSPAGYVMARLARLLVRIWCASEVLAANFHGLGAFVFLLAASILQFPWLIQRKALARMLASRTNQAPGSVAANRPSSLVKLRLLIDWRSSSGDIGDYAER